MRKFGAALLALMLSPVWAGAEEAVMREIAGTLTYQQRIALPPDAQVTVVAQGLRDVVLGETRFAADGAQVPLPFAVAVPTGVPVRLMATVGAEGGPQWAAGPLVVAADATEAGEILLRPGGLPFEMVCGDLRLTARFDGSGMEISTYRGDMRMAEAMSASGARFEAEGDPSSWFWSKGDVATLSLWGEEFPECRMAPPQYTARGNEPFWTFAVSDRDFVLVTPDGVQAVGEVPEAVWRDGAVEWDMPDQGLRLRMVDALCRDTMTGMPFPETAILTTPEGEVTGCGGDPAALLAGGEWMIEDVAAGGIIDGAMLTIAFHAQGAVAGTGGCNRFSGSFRLTGEELSFGPVASTMMACPEAVMALEQALFEALRRVARFDIDPTGALLLLDVDGTAVVTARR
jgi:heat shock protein HslJ